MNQSPITVADELAAALLTLLGAINEHNQRNGIISKEVAVNLARIALEHYAQSKKDKSNGN